MAADRPDMTDRPDTPQPLAAVYLLNGDDDLKRDMLLRRLGGRIAESGDLMMNQQTLGPEALKDPEQLLEALNTPPFGGDRRLLVLHGAERLPKDVSEALIGYIQDPCPTTVLALLANKLATSTRLYKAIVAYDKRSVVDVSSMKRSELPQHLRRLAEGYRLALDYEAAQSLINRIGTSTPALNNELRRLAAWASAAGKAQVTASDIVEQVPALVEPKPWELADALCQRDLALTLRMLAQMNSTQPTAAFTFCVARLREVLSVIALKARGMASASQVAGYLGRQEWQVRGSLAAAGRFSEQELSRLIREAQRHEKAMKSGADPEHVLTLWLIEVCRGA
jgi:DNA polymerase-3 subunit delta